MLLSRNYRGWEKDQKTEEQETLLLFKEGNKKGTSSAEFQLVEKMEQNKKTDKNSAKQFVSA